MNPLTNFDFKNLTADQLRQDLEALKTQITQTLDQVVAVTDARTFTNTVQPLINSDTQLDGKVSLQHYASNVYPQKEVRDAGSECEREFSQFGIEAGMRRDVYQACSDYYNNGYQQEKDQLTQEEIRYVEHMMRGYRRSGLSLGDEEFEKYKELKKRLSDLGVSFRSNVNEESTSFEFTKAQLEGMPSDWFVDDKLVTKGVTTDSDVYKMTLKYPDYIPAVDYVKDTEVRHKLWRAYGCRCKDENVPIFEEAIKLRYQMAQMLGYKDHADFKTETKIVKSGKNAYDFLSNLNQLFTPGLDRDLTELTKFAKSYKENPLQKAQLDPWDFRYYMRAYKEEVNQVDLEEVKSYFPLEKVTSGLFTIYQDLLGLKFKRVETENKWSDKVDLYQVNDRETGELMGYFFFDLHPREGKYSHACVSPFQSPCDMTKIDGSGYRPAIATIICNFPETGCISFDNVTTFFHEFGHLMHHICSRPQLSDHSGLGVEWDFVEAPSQMLEFWCFEEGPLALMSSHKETGEKIPKSIVDKLHQMELTLNGYFYKRQLTYGLFDLKVHRMTFDNQETFDSTEIWYQNQREVMGLEDVERTAPHAAFGHLMGGYDAGYYGYLRAETYAANMFYKWFKEGHVLDPEIGMRYRRKLLQPGSSKDALDLLVDFLGEQPDDTYFLIDKGLQPQTATE